MKKFALIGAVAFLSACASAPKKTVDVRVSEDQVSQAYAESLVKKGHYLAFKKAFGLYRNIYSRRALRPKVAAGYVRAGLLLALRERQIGLDDPGTLAEVNRVIGENRSLASFAAPALVISAIPPRTRGVMKDIAADTRGQDDRERLRAAEEELRSAAPADELSAAVLAAWTCQAGRYSAEYRDLAEYLKARPDSLLLKYEAAVCGEVDPGLAEALLAEEPEFAEARYHLGEAALREKRLLDAEAHLLRAFEAIPESPQPRILLAGVYFATEEFAASLRFYDLALEVSPEYRDALLGKAISLAYLGRHDESMAVLDRILELGFWLLGESHYWLAWNLQTLKRGPEALRHIDEAKGRLPTNSHVFSLAGTIAMELGELERAEKDFMESLVYDPANTEALSGLGTLHARRARWPMAAEFYEKAGRAYAAEGEALAAVIEGLRASALAPERKARLVQRRTSQLERVRFENATADYNAAAAYFNAGNAGKALETAAKAAAHPALREKAEEILRNIRK